VTVTPDDEALAGAGLTRAEVANWNFKAGAGCGHCRGVGYRGRHAVAEVLVLDDTLREMIVGRVPISVLKARAAERGLRPLHASALQWVARGDTTLEELARVAG
jgi:general secretion pathway protein E